MKIFIKVIDGLHEIEVELSDTMKEIKEEIKRVLGVPVNKQRLTWDGVGIDSNKQLKDFYSDKEYYICLHVKK